MPKILLCVGSLLGGTLSPTATSWADACPASLIVRLLDRKVAKKDAQGLVEIFKDSVEAGEALHALSLESQSTIESCFQHSSAAVRLAWIDAAKNGDAKTRPRFTPLVAKLLKDVDTKVAIAAARALPSIGHSMAVPCLMEAYPTSRPPLRTNIGIALLGAGEAVIPAIPELKKWFRLADLDIWLLGGELLFRTEEKGMAAVAEMLRDADPRLRERAAYLIYRVTEGGNGDYGTATAVIAAVKDPDPCVRHWAKLARRCVEISEREYPRGKCTDSAPPNCLKSPSWPPKSRSSL
jgi:hypothetical protein